MKKRDLVIELAVMVAIGVTLAALGPFGSFQTGPFADRLAYWLPVSLLAYAVFRPVIAFFQTQSERLELSRSVATLAGIAVAAAPASFVILWWNGNGFNYRPDFGPWFQLYLQVAFVGALVTLAFAAIESRMQPGSEGGGAAVDPPPAAPSQASGPPQAAPKPPFLARLPESWNGQLTALEMEDHYVRAHGPEASLLILMRLRDAEAELTGVEGLRVHRSWWVAKASVEQVVRDGRSVRLRLTGGVEAPVARDRLAALRSAGWLS